MSELYPLLDPYVKVLEEYFRLVCQLWLERVNSHLQAFAAALDQWLHDLFRNPTPDWRERFDLFLAQQLAEGRQPTPESRQELLDFLEGWAASVDWNTVERRAASKERSTDDIRRDQIQPGAALWNAYAPSDDHAAVFIPQGSTSRPINEPPSTGVRPSPSEFAREAEEIVSDATGVPRNQGPGRQTIPGSGPGGFRIPDLKVRGPQGSVRLRGTVVEVKASRSTKFGTLSGASRRQIKDAIEYVLRLRRKASLVKDPALKSLLEKAHVEVFSDLAQPKIGKFAVLIEEKLLKWRPIPRPVPVRGAITGGVRSKIPGAPRSIGKPGAGTAANIALGIIASIAEAGVADEIYEDATSALNGLLQQMEVNGDGEQHDWKNIEQRLREIANMKQSTLGYVLEIFTYGQRSLKEQQAEEMMLLAEDLGEKFGYQRTRTWGDAIKGRFGKFEKKNR